ncbi:MAG TPA: FtsX-like permease family protein [Gemmatimonadaceae bacterium]|nr:FtsX-like permease family protein [Gemmatimonadaceae bacterium]
MGEDRDSQLSRALLLFGALLVASGAPLRLVEAQRLDTLPPRAVRTIAIDERLAVDAGIRLGARVTLATTPGGAADTARVVALVRRRADPSEVARGDYQIRLHLDYLQRLTGAGDRVDRFALATRDEPAAVDSALRAVNAAAFGFRAHRSRDIAVETSTTFAVVSRFHRAIGVITIVASAIFLLCIMLLKIDERRRDVAALRLMGISARTVMRSVMLEAAFIATLGSVLGVGIGAAASAIVNWHYRGVYRTPLAFSLVTPGVVTLAVVLSVLLGLAAGLAASSRLLRVPPLALFGR